MLSSEDLFLVAASLRHERAQRLYNAQKRGHRPRAIEQLHRLEDVFGKLARARREVEQREARARREAEAEQEGPK